MIPSIPLANGIQIPVLGFGTYKLTENVVSVVGQAIDLGYRHIDTAQMYGNEAEVGQAWTASGLARDEFFLTTKLDNGNHEPQTALASFDRSLEALQTDYVDLFLIHWPLPDLHPDGYQDVWGVMEAIYASGRARAIGLSNFYEKHLTTLLRDAEVVPHVNQIESHPYLPQRSLHQLDDAHGIRTEAWSPLARGKVVTDPVLRDIGRAHGKTATQVAIRWGLQRGDILFPKATAVSRQQENMDVFDFELSPTEMTQIDALDQGEGGRVGSHPEKKA